MKQRKGRTKVGIKELVSEIHYPESGPTHQTDQPAANEETGMPREAQPDPTPGGGGIKNVHAPGAVIINGNIGDNTTINAAPVEDASADRQARDENTAERQIIRSPLPNRESIHPDLRDAVQSLHEFMMLLRRLDR